MMASFAKPIKLCLMGMTTLISTTVMTLTFSNVIKVFTELKFHEFMVLVIKISGIFLTEKIHQKIFLELGKKDNSFQIRGNGGWWYGVYSDGDPNPNGRNTGQPEVGTEFMGTPFKRICDCIARNEHYDLCENLPEREKSKSFKTIYLVLHKKSA